MDVDALLDLLLAAEDDTRRQALLVKYAQLLSVTFFISLKNQATYWAQREPTQARRITAIASEAAKFMDIPQGYAYVWWAQGNVALFVGKYDDCLAAYTAASAIFTELGDMDLVAQLQSNSMLPLIYTGRYAEAQTLGQCALPVVQTQPESSQMANLLLNLGICNLHLGKSLIALEEIQRAADIFTQLGNIYQAARCHVTQSVVLRSLDRFSEAESLLHKALEISAAHQAWVPWARAAMNLGNLRARLFDHQTALQWLVKSRQAFKKADIVVDTALVDFYRVRSFLAVNLLPEALDLGKTVLQIFKELGMLHLEARASALLAEVYTQLGQFVSAKHHFEHARQIFQELGDFISDAHVAMQLAIVLRQQGQSNLALHLASTARDMLDLRNYPVRHAEASLVLAACCEDLGLLEEAQVAYRVAWATGSHPTDTTEPPAFLAYRIAYARGVLAEAAGMQSLARGEYERAVTYLERIAQGLGLDELRGGYLSDKRPVYESALRLALADNRLTDAFHIAELARAGALRDVIGNKPRITIDNEREQYPDFAALKAQWAWRSSWLHRPEDLDVKAASALSFPDSQSQETLIRELADLERELSDIYRTQRLVNPRFAVLNQGAVLGIREVQAYLDESTALLAFDYLDDDLWVFVLTATTVRVVSLGSLSQLRWETSALRHSLEEVRMFNDTTDLEWLTADLQASLCTLYYMVLAEPLACLDTTIQHLWIVPCDVLHTLPLEALYSGQHYVVEQYSIAYLASASLLAALPERHNTVPVQNSLVMANSYEGTLPWVIEECTTVAQILAEQWGNPPETLTEEQATTTALHIHASTANLLHLIAHGTFRADAPLFSTLHLADAPLTVNDIYNLDLAQTSLVVLSGCQTGLGEGRGGELLGLAHAFYFAGVPSLVVSRWRVDDAATVELMRGFYTGLTQGLSVAGALRASQLAMLEQYPHAYYWAGFAVLGRGFDTIFGNSSD